MPAVASDDSPAELPLPAGAVGVVCALWLAAAGVVAFLSMRGPGRDLLGVAAAGALALWAAVVALHGLRARRRRTRAATFGWLGAQLAAMLLVAGLGAANVLAWWKEQRLARWDATTKDYEDLFDLAEVDKRRPGLGGLLPPNLRARVKGGRPGETVDFVTNALGFRGAAETAIPKPPNTTRILFLGDSFVAGYRMDEGEVFGARLADHLRAIGAVPDGTTLEVLNGVTMDPPTTWWYLQEHAAALEPDLVVINICLANDLLQSLVYLGGPGTPRTMFIAETAMIGRGPSLRRVPDEELPALGVAWTHYLSAAVSPYPAAAFDGPYVPPAAPNPSRWALGRVLQRAWGGVRGYEGFSHAPTPDDSLFHWGQTGFLLRDPPPAIDAGYGNTDECREAFGWWSQVARVPVLVTLIPLRYQVIPQDRDATFAQGRLKFEAFFLERPQRDHGGSRIYLFDFTDGFRAFGERAHEYFLSNGDCHWNARGHDEAVRLLAPKVAEVLDRARRGLLLPGITEP